MRFYVKCCGDLKGIWPAGYPRTLGAAQRRVTCRHRSNGWSIIRGRWTRRDTCFGGRLESSSSGSNRGTEGETEERGCGEPRPFSIAGVVKHICEAECYWLREVHIEPEFVPPQQSEWRAEVFQEALDTIEKQYHRILAGKPNDPDILFGLSRVCQHNVYHAGQAAHLRALQDPEWKGAGAGETGSWEQAVDYLAEMLIG